LALKLQESAQHTDYESLQFSLFDESPL
jgi:hypothetical protein